MKRLIALAIIAMILISLCGCDRKIPDGPVVSGDPSLQGVPDHVISLPSNDENDDGEPDLESRVILNTSGSLFGSYLTMCSKPGIKFPYIKVFNSAAEISEYYNANSEMFSFGHNFTKSCELFNDEFLKDNDVLMLVLSENSSYIGHSANSVTVTTNGIEFDITCTIPQDAPISSTEYHLIFTASDGAFDGMGALPFKLNITEVIEKPNNLTFDADRFKMIYPEFWPYVYRCDASGKAETIVDTITSYSELISFYEQYKDAYDLSAFKEHIGPLYDQYSFFDDYVLLTILVPSKNETDGIAIDELFVYNLDIYVTVKGTSPTVISDKTECYLVTAAITKSDIEGVNLDWFNISFE